MLLQGLKLLGFQISGTPKNGDENPNLWAGFPTRNTQIKPALSSVIKGAV